MERRSSRRPRREIGQRGWLSRSIGEVLPSLPGCSGMIGAGASCPWQGVPHGQGEAVDLDGNPSYRSRLHPPWAGRLRRCRSRQTPNRARSAPRASSPRGEAVGTTIGGGKAWLVRLVIELGRSGARSLSSFPCSAVLDSGMNPIFKAERAGIVDRCVALFERDKMASTVVFENHAGPYLVDLANLSTFFQDHCQCVGSAVVSYFHGWSRSVLDQSRNMVSACHSRSSRLGRRLGSRGRQISVLSRG